MKRVYTSSDLSFVIPTYNRPEQLRKLLTSLAAQEGCGGVVVVGSGENVGCVVSEFADSLPIQYLHSDEGGQILQRNKGIALLGESASLVGFLDDDLVLECGALSAMIECWNRVPEETAGVAFNIINEGQYSHNWKYGLFCLSSSRKGEVLSSGFAVPFYGTESDVPVRWLGGGYTVWRKGVVHEFPQQPVNSRWAIGEDVRFSYPVGKKYPLHVCASARVRHEHVVDQAPLESVHCYRGRKWGVAQYYFVKQHEELSGVACLWMVFGSAAVHLFSGLRRGDHAAVRGGQGRLAAVGDIVLDMMGIRDVTLTLEDGV